MKKVGYFNYVINYKNIEKKETKEKIDDLISEYSEIKSNLNEIIPDIKKDALLPGYLMKELILDENN